MAKVTQYLIGPNSVSSSTTEYIPFVSGTAAGSTTEVQKQVTYRVAGTLSNLYIRVTSSNVGASTARVRINGANGNQSISIGASSTGEFEDNTNTDIVSVADEVNFSITTGAGGIELVYEALTIIFSANTNTVVHLGADGGPVSSASVTAYTPISGPEALITTEANAVQEINTAGTLKNLFIYITSNARTTTTTFTSRKNAADGTLTVSIGASATGIFEDTSNSDTIVTNDELDTKIVTGTGTETITISFISYAFETTNSKFVAGVGTSNVIDFNETNYVGIGGNWGAPAELTTESDRSAEVNIACDMANLWVLITANTMNGAGTVNLRKNQVNGNVSVSITASTTGQFEDSTNTDSFEAIDEVNYRVIGGGSSGSFTVSNISILISTVVRKIYSEGLRPAIFTPGIAK